MWKVDYFFIRGIRIYYIFSRLTNDEELISLSINGKKLILSLLREILLGCYEKIA